jgi:hypothetical protein
MVVLVMLIFMDMVVLVMLIFMDMVVMVMVVLVMLIFMDMVVMDTLNAKIVLNAKEMVLSGNKIQIQIRKKRL